jgi:hypothetical protein
MALLRNLARWPTIIYCEAHIWCFTLEHIGELWRLVEHVHVIVRTHNHLKKHVNSISHTRQSPQAWWSVVNFSLYSLGLFLISNPCTQHFISYKEIPSLLASSPLRTSIVERRLYSSLKHKVTDLRNNSRHSKAQLSPFWYTHQWIYKCYRTQAYIRQVCTSSGWRKCNSLDCLVHRFKDWSRGVHRFF